MKSSFCESFGIFELEILKEILDRNFLEKNSPSVIENFQQISINKK